MGAEPTDAQRSDLASKLNKLFEVMHKPSEPALSNVAVAEAITKSGVPISHSYISQLRNGVKTNPTVTHLRAIAEFFGVPAAYLIEDDTQEIDARLNLLQAMRDTGVRDIAMRASGLTPQALNNIAAMIDHVRQLEKLPPVSRHDQ